MMHYHISYQIQFKLKTYCYISHHFHFNLYLMKIIILTTHILKQMKYQNIYLRKAITQEYEVQRIYHLKVNSGFEQKAFIDKLRTRNGNLNITLTLSDNAYTKNV